MGKFNVLVLLLLSLCKTCIAQNNFNISSEHEVYQCSYVVVDYPVIRFDVIYNVPVIPIYNGIFGACAHEWLKKMDGDIIQAICPSVVDSSIYYLRAAGEFVHIIREFPSYQKKEEKTVFKLPNGYYDIKSFGNDSLIVWGVSDKNVWEVFSVKNNNIYKILTGQKPIIKVEPLKDNAIIYATEKEIITLIPGSSPIKLIESSTDIEGMTVSINGDLFFSTDNKIIELKQDGTVSTLATGISGHLQYYDNKLFVLYDKASQIVIIKMSNR
jgi:hypothetical protein